MSNPVPVLIGVLASVAIVVQNRGAALAFGWAAIHGSPGAFLAFAPAAAALALLWFGYIGLRRLHPRSAAWTFSVFALGLVALNETVLPSTPLKDWRTQRLLRGISVTGIRDEPLRSARANPIGIRYRFEIVVPRTDEYMVRTSALLPAAANIPHMLLFNTVAITTDPAPRQEDPVYSTLEQGVTYTFTIDLMPVFAGLDRQTKQPCLVDAARRGASQQEFLAALSGYRDVRFRADITVSHDGETTAAVRDYTTCHFYDVYDMYQRLLREGAGPCAS